MDFEKYGPVYRNGKVVLVNADCMEVMADMPNGYAQLAITDPPYGIGAGGKTYGKRRVKHDKKNWDENAPGEAYFSELKRVSKNQIIWGGNYFQLPLTNGWIYWDKGRDKETTFSDGELAWTSVLSLIRCARIRYDGFIGADIDRIHPTQKPVKLYEWLLKNYAKEGDRILDTHLGSGSSAIAAHYGGFDFVGCELDEDYYKAACERFDMQTRQQALAI